MSGPGPSRGTAVVTGAASGIGLALVRRLAAEGLDVLAVDVSPDGVYPAGVRSVLADVGDAEGWADVARDLERVDLAFLNAGVTSRTASFLDAAWEEAREVLRVNLEGVLLGVRALVPLMAAGGAVVVTGSGGAVDPVQTDPVYTASKLGVVGLVRAAAGPLAARGVRLSAVCPALVDTPLLGAVGRLMGTAGFGLLSADDVAEVLLRAAREAEPGAVWGLRPDTGAFPLAFPRFEPS